MRKGKKGGQGEEPDIENQMGDIEEGGIKADSASGPDLSSTQSETEIKPTKASDDDEFCVSMMSRYVNTAKKNKPLSLTTEKERECKSERARWSARESELVGEIERFLE